MDELNFIESINTQLTKYGYTVTEIKHHCRSCKFWNGEKTSLGIRCTCNDKPFRSAYSMYKASGNPACKYYQEEGDKNEKEHTSNIRNIEAD